MWIRHAKSPSVLIGAQTLGTCHLLPEGGSIYVWGLEGGLWKNIDSNRGSKKNKYFGNPRKCWVITHEKGCLLVGLRKPFYWLSGVCENFAPVRKMVYKILPNFVQFRRCPHSDNKCQVPYMIALCTIVLTEHALWPYCFSMFACVFHLEFLIFLKFDFKHSVYTRSQSGKSSQDKKTIQLLLLLNCYPQPSCGLEMCEKQIADSERKMMFFVLKGFTQFTREDDLGRWWN